MRRLKLRYAFASLGAVCLYCEFLHYYLVIFLWCSWPKPPSAHANQSKPAPLKLMVLADTHLLGVRRGHWFDKLRREWQMYRAFQTANFFFNPEVVFFLGDLFDEGQWATPGEFRTYVDRFHSLFAVRRNEQSVIAVAGNHDVGFHYAWSIGFGEATTRVAAEDEATKTQQKIFYGSSWIHPMVLTQFQRQFHTEPVRLVSIGGVHFVLMNSMAMEDDGCRFCQTAERQMKEVNQTLGCLKHFPLFRSSDSDCSEPDEAPTVKEKEAFMRPKWEVISKDATKKIVDSFHPRAVFSGHSHHGCTSYHRYNGGKDTFWEWTISSFSWRNRPNPAFLLVTVFPDDQDFAGHHRPGLSVSKCMIPNEQTVIFLYAATISLALLIVLATIFTALRDCWRGRRAEKRVFTRKSK